MSSSNILESQLRKYVVIIINCSIIHVLYKLNVFILLLLCLCRFSTCLLIVLVGNFFIIVFFDICVWKVGTIVSLLVTSKEYCALMPIVIVYIIVPFCDLMRKLDSIYWWGSCTWLKIPVFIKKLVYLNHILRVVIIPLGELFYNYSIILSYIFLSLWKTN